MISSASSKKLSASTGGLPNMSGALLSWFQKITFILITKEIVDFDLVEVERKVCFDGVRQPLSPQKLSMKPEGQRAWKWEQIHALPSVKLKIDDRMNFNGEKFRVMERLDYSEYGYIEYHTALDYEEYPNGSP